MIIFPPIRDERRANYCRSIMAMLDGLNRAMDHLEEIAAPDDKSEDWSLWHRRVQFWIFKITSALGERLKEFERKRAI